MRHCLMRRRKQTMMKMKDRGSVKTHTINNALKSATSNNV